MQHAHQLWPATRDHSNSLRWYNLKLSPPNLKLITLRVFLALFHADVLLEQMHYGKLNLKIVCLRKHKSALRGSRRKAHCVQTLSNPFCERVRGLKHREKS